MGLAWARLICSGLFWEAMGWVGKTPACLGWPYFGLFCAYAGLCMGSAWAVLVMRWPEHALSKQWPLAGQVLAPGLAGDGYVLS
jgi:hypothetical protein